VPWLGLRASLSHPALLHAQDTVDLTRIKNIPRTRIQDPLSGQPAVPAWLPNILRKDPFTRSHVPASKNRPLVHRPSDAFQREHGHIQGRIPLIHFLVLCLRNRWRFVAPRKPLGEA
jgi:hypothetical protein